jgi:histidinol-phosphate phosphatase family protein
MPTGADRRAVFLDRDGTVIHDLEYPRDPDKVWLVPGAATALARLRGAGFALVLISNQSGMGRGLITQREAELVHERMIAVLADSGVRLDGVYYCPHAPDAGCGCRKPAPGLVRDAASRLGIDLGRSFMVGDKPGDIEAGRRAGCRTVQLTADRWHGPCEPPPDAVAADWDQAVAFILGPGELRT